MKRVLAFSLLLLALAGCSRGRPELHLPPEGALLPSHHASGWIQVALPDGRPRTAWFDSGATVSSVGQKELDGLGLPSTGACLPNPVVMFDHTEWFPRRVCFGSLSLGEAVIRGLDADVKRGSAQGLMIGEDVLALCACLLDWRKGESRLLPSEGLSGRLEALYPGRRWTKLPFTRWCGLPIVSIPLEDGREIGMLVDTGSDRTFFDSGTTKSLGLAEGSVQGIRIGGEERRTTVHCHEGGLFSVPAGILGMDQLGQTPFVLDGPGNTLWIADKAKP